MTGIVLALAGIEFGGGVKRCLGGRDDALGHEQVSARAGGQADAQRLQLNEDEDSALGVFSVTLSRWDGTLSHERNPFSCGYHGHDGCRSQVQRQIAPVVFAPMRLLKVMLNYKGEERISFDAGPLTVLFGRNNSGKTNILESLYSDLVAEDKRFVRTREMSLGLQTVSPGSAVCFDLECGVAFDEDVLAEVDRSASDETPRRATFDSGGGWFVCPPEPDDWWAPPSDWRGYEMDEDSFLGYRRTTVGPRLRVTFLDWEVSDLNARVEEALGPNWLENASDRGEAIGMAEAPIDRLDLRWRWNPVMAAQLDQIITLATDLLPDFVNPDLEGRVNYPRDWEEFGRVDLHCEGVPLENMGQGTARWIATAVQMALKLVGIYPGLRTSACTRRMSCPCTRPSCSLKVSWTKPCSKNTAAPSWRPLE